MGEGRGDEREQSGLDTDGELVWTEPGFLQDQGLGEGDVIGPAVLKMKGAPGGLVERHPAMPRESRSDSRERPENTHF